MNMHTDKIDLSEIEDYISQNINLPEKNEDILVGSQVDFSTRVGFAQKLAQIFYKEKSLQSNNTFFNIFKTLDKRCFSTAETSKQEYQLKADHIIILLQNNQSKLASIVNKHTPTLLNAQPPHMSNSIGYHPYIRPNQQIQPQPMQQIQPQPMQIQPQPMQIQPQPMQQMQSQFQRVMNPLHSVISNKNYTPMHKLSNDQVLRELKELFQNNIDLYIIEWVAHFCDYHIETCVPILIDIKIQKNSHHPDL